MSTPITPTNPSCTLLTLPAPEMVQGAPPLEITELGQYWADLTTKEGPPICNCFFEGRTELEFAVAYEAGKALLPKGDDDALLAYFLNATPLYFAHFQKYPPTEKRELKTESLFSQYLLNHEMTRSLWVLQVLGSLEARVGEKCRIVSENQLQLSWGKNLFVQLHCMYDFCFNSIMAELNQKQSPLYLAFINGLTLLTPQQCSNIALDSIDPRLIEVYQVLKHKNDYWSIFRYLSLLGSAGYNPIDSKTVLDLPDQLSFIEKMKQFDKLMPRLKSAYKNSQFAHVVEAACNSPAAPRQAAVEALRVCKDAEVLAFAWRLEDEKRVDFLLEAASTMPEEALPFALNHLIALCKTETHVKLVGAYLQRLMRASSALKAGYESTLVRLLSKHKTSNELLSAYPGVMQNYFPNLRPLLTIETASQLIDQMTKCYAHVTDTTIVRDLAELLVHQKADSALWSKFKTLLKTLIQDGRFIEEVIAVFETVAKTAEAVGCFEVEIPQLGKRKPDQKQRIARAYAASIQLQSDPKIRDRLIGTFADGWLLGQLRKDESWEAFADLLLYSCAKKDFKDQKVVQGIVQDALWVASHLLGQDPCPLFARFEAQVLRFPNRCLDAEWKPHLARMLVRNPGNIQLLTKLVEFAGKAEKRVLQECQKDGKPEVIRGCMRAYLETGTFAIPKPAALSLSQQFQNALNSNNLPLAVSLLRKMTGPQWELWKQFFGCLPEKPDPALAEQAWIVWLEKHPIEDHKAEDETYWKEALEKLLSYVRPSPALYDFIINHSGKVAARLAEENSLVLIGCCLELGIAACWNKMTEEPAPLLRALLPFRSQLHLIKAYFVESFYLMLAHQSDDDLYQVGNSEFLARVEKAPEEPAFFKAYSIRPYLPKTIEDQNRLMNWVTKCLSSFHTQISWVEKCRILSVLCRVSFEKMEENQRIADLASLGILWDNLLLSLRQALGSNPKCADYFLTVTKNYIDAAMKHMPRKSMRYNVLVTARRGFVEQLSTCISEEIAVQFRLHNCFHLFSLLPLDFEDVNNAIVTAIVDLNLCFVYFIQNAKKELPEHVGKLLPLLGPLLNHPHPDVSGSLGVTCENLMESPLITKAKAPSILIWEAILHNLCLNILGVHPERRKDALIMIAKLFKHCTNPRLDKQFIDLCVDLLGNIFLTIPFPESLPDEEWKGLLGGLSSRSIRRLTAIYKKEIEKKPIEKSFTSSTSLARVICYANSRDKQLLAELHQLCDLGTGAHYDNLCAKSELQLCMRLQSQWIRAISSLSNKELAISKDLLARKITMTTALTIAARELIVDSGSYQRYSPLLVEAMASDFNLEVTKLIYSLLPEDSVPELNTLKEGLKQAIQLVKE